MYASLLAQGRHGVYATGAACGDKTGEERGEDENGNGDGEG